MVSVVIPLYNAGSYIVSAVESVLRQRLPLEIIVVDDASTDGGADDLVAFLRKLEGCTDNDIGEPLLIWQGNVSFDVRIYRNPTNRGVAYSRNFGVKKSRGQYVAFLDADDIWADDKLQKQLKIMEGLNVPFCNTARYVFEEDINNIKGTIHTPERITLNKLEHTNYVNCSSVLIKREVALRYPMEHSDAQEDYLTWLRILKDYEYAAGIDEPLIYYRMVEGSKSRNKIKSAIMTYKTYRYAGYNLWAALRMMFSYTVNGINKYFFKKNR